MDLTEQKPLELRRSTNGGYLFIDQKDGDEAGTVVNFRGADDPPKEEFLQEMMDRYNEHTLLKLTLQMYFQAQEENKPEYLEKLKKDFEGVEDPWAYKMHVASLRIGLKQMERKVAALIVTLG